MWDKSGWEIIENLLLVAIIWSCLFMCDHRNECQLYIIIYKVCQLNAKTISSFLSA